MGVTSRIPAGVLVQRVKANGSSFPDVVGTPNPTTHLTLFFIMEINTMETKYKLLVKGVGNYGADSLIELYWIVFKHRCEHLLKGEGWRD